MDIKSAWELPLYIETLINPEFSTKFRMKLGQFTSHYVRVRTNMELYNFKLELELLSDFELGELFMIEQMYYSSPSFQQWYNDIHNIIAIHGESKVFCDLGFTIRGRIPFAYAKYNSKEETFAPSQISYEDAKRIWG